ncbi:Protein of unknown function, DUF488 [Desulfuromusa kysingii]|uniref:DUF488 domain-containing protein n=1 Tax=Desulfuromusa kysingii TaxID=37625 RepID=A0A1H4EIH9_9BACT|nr:DUF488 domain-containing protein [Desulfuromusa kysingii]SEA84360.1 Protein of unknown function, DUF488 [Desulfuromusa kysingii]
MIKLFTVGFTKKSAKEFFGLLKAAGINKILDVRRNNVSQLAAFAKGEDLKYFARELIDAGYEHDKNLAPPQDLLKRYRDKEVSWREYEVKYIETLNRRNVLTTINFAELDGSCLLCSEHEPNMCHRRLLAEYLRDAHGDIEIIHLIR